MLTDLIAWLAPFAYVGVALGAARPVYGRARAYAIDTNMRRYPSSYSHKRPNDAYDHALTVLVAIGTALLWPVALMSLVVFVTLKPLARAYARWMRATPMQSRTEIDNERRAMARRIRELERQNGIGGNDVD